MKVFHNVYTIDNHPNPQKVYDWIRDNLHSTGLLNTGSGVKEFKELIESNKEMGRLFYENGSPYMYDGVLLDEDPVAAAEDDAQADIEKVCKVREETWKEVKTLQSQTSYGVKAVNVEPTISITVGIKECGTRGYFEFYDTNNPDEWYAEGGLWFRGNKLVDYDGVMVLSSFVEDKLKEWGYEIDL